MLVYSVWKPKVKWTSPDVEGKLRTLVQASSTIANVCRVFGLHAKGSNFKTIYRHALRLGLDLSYVKGREVFTVQGTQNRQQLRAVVFTRNSRSKARYCRSCAGTVSQEPSRIQQTAEELKVMVWEEPVSVLAQRLGVSDVTVKKRCKKLGVPTPPRGYWSRRAGKI